MVLAGCRLYYKNLFSTPQVALDESRILTLINEPCKYKQFFISINLQKGLAVPCFNTCIENSLVYNCINIHNRNMKQGYLFLDIQYIDVIYISKTKIVATQNYFHIHIKNYNT